MPDDRETELLEEEAPTAEKVGPAALRIITWFSLGVAVAAIGIFVGRRAAQPLSLQEAYSLRLLRERRRAAGQRVWRRNLSISPS